MSKHNLPLIIAVICLSPAIWAGTAQETVGARPSAMGCAFVGVADDGNAIYWNPAGMSFLNHHEIATMYSDLFGLDIANNYLAYTYPVTSRVAVGLDWFNLGYDDPELEYSFNKFNFGAAFLIGKRTSVGAALKYLNTSTSYDGRSMGKGNGWTGDAGILHRLSDRLSAGLTVTNIFDGRMTYDNGSKSLLYEMGARAGIGVKPTSKLLVAVDVGDRFHLGTEYVAHEILALRGGLQRDLGRGKETVLSLGLGVKYSPLQIDYSYTHYPHLDHTSRISLTAFFNFGRSLVTIENVRLISGRGLYPALWSHYGATPMLQFELRNRSDKPLQCNWNVDLGNMVGRSTSGETVLRAGEVRTLYATADMSEEFWSNPSDNFVSGEVMASYTTGRNVKSATQRFQTLVYEQGAIDWNAGVERVASFVNPKDPILREIATRCIDLSSESIDETSVTAKIQYAMAVFNGLNSMGLKYLPDPNNPYEQARSAAGYIDNIQLPSELLNRRLGDCDDLTAVYCALLESVGIQTVAVDVPGHLFMAFDTGVPAVYAASLLVSDHLLVVHDDRIFVPIEVTAVQSSFAEAWTTGAATYGRWANLGELGLVDFREAWTKFPPLPAKAWASSPQFDVSALRAGMVADRSTLVSQNEAFLANNYYQQIDSLTSDVVLLNRAGVQKIHNGEIHAAKGLLVKALEVDPERSVVVLNLANVLALEGNFDSALSLWSRIATESRPDGYCGNMLTARCLTLDRTREAVSDVLMAFVKEHLISCGGGVPGQIRPEALDQCLSLTSNGLELAECMGATIFPPETKATKSDAVRLSGDEQEAIPEVRLFQWYY